MWYFRVSECGAAHQTFQEVLVLDISREQIITLAEASHRLPGRPDISTLWRWRSRGVRGVTLDSVVIGGRRYTSVEALERFAQALTAAPRPPSPGPSAARQRQIAAAEAACEAAGI
jgi:hypothetical protein